MIVKLKNISKTYGVKALFNDASVILNQNQKIGVVGTNGSGKSTLLKILTEEETVDAGEVNISGKIELAYLNQENVYLKNIKIWEYIESNPTYNKETEYEIKSILNKFQIRDLEKDIEQLSGGEQRKIELAITLVAKSNCLVLDEPTNHLDISMLIWLEKYLKNLKKSLIIVSHDRFFLDQICTQILEISMGKLHLYQGNFSASRKEMLQKIEDQNASDRKHKAQLKVEEKWIKRGVKARRTKSKYRIEQFEEAQKYEAREEAKTIEVFDISQRLGTKVINVIDAEKNFKDKIILQKWSYTFSKRDRIGIVGGNGVGKSTFLKILAGEEKLTNGKIEYGDTVKIAFFEQGGISFPENSKVIDYILDIASEINLGERTVSSTKLLDQFLFSKESQYNYISKLSGGEKRRLYLLSLLIKQPNVLLLDEPTNDFDLETVETLEKILLDFEGVVITVSHDRYFLKKVTNQIFEFQEQGSLITHNTENFNFTKSNDTNEINKPKIKKKENSSQNKKKLKMTYQEQKDFLIIDEQIEQLEKEISVIDIEIGRSKNDFEELQKLIAKRADLEKELEGKINYWEHLYQLNDIIHKRD